MNQSDLNAWLGYGTQLMGANMDMMMQYSSQKWKEKEAKKVREWNEQMYERQLEDNRENWRMANEYALPSAQLARIREAGLNPLLMYEGGLSQQVASPAQGADVNSAPAATGSMQTNYGQALSGAALIKAQIDNINADTLLKKSTAKETETHVDWYNTTKSLDLAIKERNYDKMSYEIQKIATESNALADMTWKNLEYLDKSMEMMDKHYNLAQKDYERNLAYNLADIAVRNRQVDATLKQIAVNMYDAVTKRKMALSDIAKNSAEIKEIMSRTDLNQAEKQKKVQETVSQLMKNQNLYQFGAESLNGAAAALILLTSNIFDERNAADFDNEMKKMMKDLGF